MQLTILACSAATILLAQAQKEVKTEKPDLPAFKEAGSQYTQLDKNIWVEKGKQGRRVLVSGVICRREAQLEEFACLTRTKEHEAIVSLDITPKVFHAALLAAGAQPGSVAKYDGEKLHPPTGDKLEITVEWKLNGKAERATAQDWIRDLKTKKSISHPFVFAGSQEIKHPISGEPYYLGDEGDLISVANFAGSIVDLAVVSSATDADHSFDAFTERIPPVDTPVVLILKPVSRTAEKAKKS
jgi:hypothetical protein